MRERQELADALADLRAVLRRRFEAVVMADGRVWWTLGACVVSLLIILVGYLLGWW